MRRSIRGGTATTVAIAVVLAVVAAVAGGAVRASAADPPGPKAEHGPPVVPAHFRGDLRRIPRGNVIQREEKPEPQSPNDAPPAAQGGDGAAQTAPAFAPAPSPTASFAGLSHSGWGAGWPPDTNGDVGPTYYVQAVNTSIGIFDKASGSRVAAVTFDDLFSGTGTPCDSSNQGDPVALYDPIGGRWIVSDFAWTNFTSGAMYQCLGVSAGPDPVTDGWNFYAFKTSNGGTLPDYPKLGVWPDGIYMSANVFATTGSGSFKNVQVWAFDRVAMEAGQTDVEHQLRAAALVGGVSVFSLLPSNARSVTGLPPAGAPNYFASIWGAYAIRVWKFHVDWTTPSNSTLTGPTNVSIATFNVGPGDVPELQAATTSTRSATG